MDADGNIDLTDAIEKMRSFFVDGAETYLYGLITAVPGLGWLAAPIIKTLFGAALTWILNRLSKWAVMEAFFGNTILRKASQARDFVDTVNNLEKLPKDVSDEKYEEAERASIAAFNRLVRLST